MKIIEVVIIKNVIGSVGKSLCFVILKKEK